MDGKATVREQYGKAALRVTPVHSKQTSAWQSWRRPVSHPSRLSRPAFIAPKTPASSGRTEDRRRRHRAAGGREIHERISPRCQTEGVL
jgi:hypothetical protein